MKRDIIIRYTTLLISLIIMAFGVAFSIKGNLGTSPISSLPYVTNQISGLTVGQTTIILHITLIIIQILLLRKNFKIFQLIQLPIAFIFGYLTDFSIYVLNNLSCSNYLMQWIYCIIGIILVGIGVSLEVISNTTTLAGEGTVLAICQVTDIQFGKVKVGFDTTLVLISIILSILFLNGLYGVREGTIAAAFFVGNISKNLNPVFKSIIDKYI